MPRRSISLFRRMERALETVDQGSTPLETIEATARTLVEGFCQDLGISSGRIYARTDEGDYEIVAAFGTASRTPVGLHVSRHYHAMERLLDEGSVVMALSDAGLDPELEERLGTRDHFAAIAVSDGAYALSFDVDRPVESVDDLLAILNIFRLAINQKLREERMLEILEDSRRIQTSILPRRIPSYGDYRMAARTVPAEVVGGDFYDFITLTDNTFCVVVADATGHGLPAALQVRDVFTGLRMGLSRDHKITRTLERLNGIIHRSRLATKFVSLFLAEIEIGGTLMYCNAGHPPALLVRTDGTVDRLTTGGMILGPRPDAHYTIDLERMAPGDLLALYSDGITEARDPTTDEEFSVDRLAAFLKELRSSEPEEIVERVIDEVSRFAGAGPPVDDQTIVVVQRRADTEES